MRYNCDQLFRGQYIHLMKLFIPLCLESPDRYYFNILRVITLFYHMYLEYEIYNLTQRKIVYKSILIYRTMDKWDVVVIFSEILRDMVH